MPDLTVITLDSLGRAIVAFACYVGVLFAASKLLPGRVVAGHGSSEGGTHYRLNGLLLFVAVLAVAPAAHLLGVFSLTWLHRHFLELLFAANVFAVGLAAVLFWTGRVEGRRRASDVWFGAERNPAWLGIDLKLFSYRPSLLGWLLLNMAFACVQYDRYGAVSSAMWLYLALSGVYLAATFQYERGLLSMYDVIEERFGLMLIWGDYVLVPFFYSLPGLFLIDRVAPLSAFELAACCLLFGFGFWLFRGANRQKNSFKSDPARPIWGRPPQTVGGRLLVSGFWGIGRKLNYTGEILVYLSWTLPCGFVSFWPFLVPVWLTVLLAHRAHRDDRRCRLKYGPLWDEYCRRARFRMVPFVY